MTRLSLAAAALCLSFAAPAGAADILGACSAEIQNRCADVNPGHGRIMSCLYAYEDQLDETCGTEIADAADILDSFFERLRYTSQECGPDIAKFCAGTEFGNGRMFSCLAENRSALSEGCATAIQTVRMPEQ